jgi:hypothetical protein
LHRLVGNDRKAGADDRSKQYQEYLESDAQPQRQQPWTPFCLEECMLRPGVARLDFQQRRLFSEEFSGLAGNLGILARGQRGNRGGEGLGADRSFLCFSARVAFLSPEDSIDQAAFTPFLLP